MRSTTNFAILPPADRLNWPVDFPVQYGDGDAPAAGRAIEMFEDGIRFVGDTPLSVGEEVEVQFPDLWLQRGNTVKWRAVVCESFLGRMRVVVLDPTEADRQRTMESLHQEVVRRYR